MRNQENIINFEQLHLNEYSMTTETRLWREVIIKALEDLRLPHTNKRYRLWQKQAEKWFKDADEEFIMVCECANLSPEHVLKLAKRSF